MSDRTTVNITKEAHSAASEDKREDESWSDWFHRNAQSPDAEEMLEEIRELQQQQFEFLLDELRDELASTEDIEGLEKRLDDFESRMPARVADELR